MIHLRARGVLLAPGLSPAKEGDAMADEVAAGHSYRQMIVALAAIPGIEVTLRGGLTADFPSLKVEWKLNARWHFQAESIYEDRSKVLLQCFDVSGIGAKRRVKIESVVGTLTQWAATLDVKRMEKVQANEASSRMAKEKVERFRTLYDDVIGAANAVTGNKRKQRFEHNPLTRMRTAEGRPWPAGTFEFHVPDTGHVTVEINVDLLHAETDDRDKVLPTVLLLHAIASAIQDARAAYVKMDAARADAAADAAVKSA